MTVTNLRHGLSKSRQYYIWRSMKQRVDNPKRKDYPHYGGRGILYDPSWAEFMCFWEDMKEGYADNLTLGSDEAFKMACEYREEMICQQELLGFKYSGFHGK